MKIIVDLCNQHHGSLKELKRMSLNAFLSGADAVKVQLMDSEKLLNTKEKKYRDINFQDAYELSKYCDDLGIEFMASVFDEDRFYWLDDLGVRTHKIASRTSKHDKHLSELILSDGKPTIISTGMHDFTEFPYGHSNQIDYLFCVSKYPTFIDDEKLAKMPFFKRPGYSGYSDHTIGIGAALRTSVFDHQAPPTWRSDVGAIRLPVLMYVSEGGYALGTPESDAVMARMRELGRQEWRSRLRG